jgi:hypothetical protein
VLSAAVDIPSAFLVMYNRSSSIHESARFWDFILSQIMILDNARSFNNLLLPYYYCSFIII